MEEIEKRAGALWAGLGVKSEVIKILQREYGLSLRQAERAVWAFIQAGGGGMYLIVAGGRVRYEYRRRPTAEELEEWARRKGDVILVRVVARVGRPVARSSPVGKLEVAGGG